MKHYTANNKQFTCPENWYEVTLEQLLKINTGITRSLEAISICTGIPEYEWNRDMNLSVADDVEQTLSFLATPGLKLEEQPQPFVFNGEVISPISDIGNLSIGQYQDLKDYIAEFHLREGDEVDVLRRLSLYPKIVAVYLQPLIDKKEYDWVRAEVISQELYNCSAMEVSAWGYFFIRKFQELRNGIVKDVQVSATMQKNRKPGFLSYLKSLVLKLFYTPSRKGI